MIYKLKTSKQTMDIFEEIAASENLAPYILSKLSISLSIREGKLVTEDFGTDNNGLELNRQTIFGEYDSIYRALITMEEGEIVSDEEYFPSTVKAHLDRGARILKNESRYSMNFYDNLTRLNLNI